LSFRKRKAYSSRDNEKSGQKLPWIVELQLTGNRHVLILFFGSLDQYHAGFFKYLGWAVHRLLVRFRRAAQPETRNNWASRREDQPEHSMRSFKRMAVKLSLKPTIGVL